MDKRIKAILVLADCTKQELAEIYDRLKAEGASPFLLNIITQISKSAP